MLLTAKKKMKHKRSVAAIVIKMTGVHCENTLKPWTTFILLANPEISKPEAKVKLNKKAVSISFIMLDVSLNSPLLMINPAIKSKTPTPMLTFADI